MPNPDDKGHDFIGAIGAVLGTILGILPVTVGAYFLGRDDILIGALMLGLVFGIFSGFLRGFLSDFLSDFFDVDTDAGPLQRSAGGFILAIVGGFLGAIVGAILVALEVISFE